MSVDLAVVGLGYVGLPLARQACDAGLATVGFDIAPAVVETLSSGRSHVHDVSTDDIARMRETGFTASLDPAIIATADTVVICVPTGLSPEGAPDLGAVRAAARTVGARLRPEMLVVLESTSYPGTTEEVLLPILESVSGMAAGKEFHLAFSPERIDPGNRRFTVGNTPKIVSGVTPLCAKYCAAFYGRFIDTVVVARGTREAEMAKLLENTYRYVNIALVNEMTVFCETMGIDAWDVLHCAGTKPFGFARFKPGPGVGGHCIPVDPLYLSSKAQSEGFTFSLLSAARDVNDGMPGYVVGRAAAMLAGQGIDPADAEVLLLGVTYKPDVPDVRESPAAGVAEGLRALGTTVAYHDPYVAEFAVAGGSIVGSADLPAALARADLAVLLQDHACYDSAVLARLSRSLLDTRGKVAGSRVEML
ncbi:nucleotide sugar dehydrogenase [Amycolatopsis nigrescens]|uniref:nucleotide sugar dehydrogenase n=1 Tax=Amycolatopsis nigrescens TaxID=381445 RepID=UPI00036126DC|nr:nucleotide sugar dehydrogenase [Amycolatopsis nigrescens]